jgi:hypothetical protein
MYASRRQWEAAYKLAKDSLDKEEGEWLEEIRLSWQVGNSPDEAVVKARMDIKNSQLAMERIEKFLAPVDRYIKVVDTAIQHSPQVTYVYEI